MVNGRAYADLDHPQSSNYPGLGCRQMLLFPFVPPIRHVPFTPSGVLPDAIALTPPRLFGPAANWRVVVTRMFRLIPAVCPGKAPMPNKFFDSVKKQ